MKTFGQLQIGNIIYKCNYLNNDIEQYEILNIEDSCYTGQLLLSLKRNDKRKNYYDYVNEQINVFINNSYESNRGIVGHDTNTMWCADKNAVYKTFDMYRNKILTELNNQEITIKNL